MGCRMEGGRKEGVEGGWVAGWSEVGRRGWRVGGSYSDQL
jgi:hypothetical protein